MKYVIEVEVQKVEKYEITIETDKEFENVCDIYMNDYIGRNIDEVEDTVDENNDEILFVEHLEDDTDIEVLDIWEVE